MWAHGVSHRKDNPGKAQGLVGPEGSRIATAQMGDGGDTASGVVGQGTHEEDGPVIWEVLTSPREVAADGAPLRKLRGLLVF